MQCSILHCTSYFLNYFFFKHFRAAGLFQLASTLDEQGVDGTRLAAVLSVPDTFAYFCPGFQLGNECFVVFFACYHDHCHKTEVFKKFKGQKGKKKIAPW